jgi:hypothetical protein
VSCRFPGCPYEIAEVHHIEFFSRGGLTVLGNLIGLCLFHHRQIHLENTLIVGDPNKQITFITKSGNTYTSRPSVAFRS